MGWLAGAAFVAIAHRAIPDAQWLMVHMLMLGGASTAILIWSAHFAETVRRRPLAGGRRMQAWRLAAHTIGAVTVISGLLADRWLVILGGAIIVGLTAMWHAATLIHQGRGGRSLLGGQFGWITWYYVASASALTLGVVGGVLLARPETSPDAAARLYMAHVPLMVLGWVGLTVVGTLITLWPSMLRAPITAAARRAGRQGVAVGSLALAVIIAGAATGLHLILALGLAIYAAGLVRTGWPHAVMAVGKSTWGFPARAVALAWLWLFGTVVWWAGNLITAESWLDVQARTAGVLVPLLVGFAAQVLLAALSHLTPVVVGGGPRGAAAARAVLERAGDARLIVLNAGLLIYVLWHVSWVRVGLSVLALAVLITTFVLIIRAVVVARRHYGDDVTTGNPPPMAMTAVQSPRHRQVSRGVAVAIVAVTVTAGVALDPAAAGLGRTDAMTVAPTGDVIEVDVTAVGMRFEPASVEVNAGDQLIINVTNADDQTHDLVFASGVSSGRLAPDDSTRVDVGLVSGDLEGWCSVAGHRQMGMTFTVTALGAANSDPAPGEPAASTDNETPASAAQDMDLRAEPGPTFTPRDPILGPAPDATTHRYTFTATESELEVAPGVTQSVWTYNGTAPGPTLRGKVGDTFEITLVNDGTMGHSIDFHAGALAPDGPMRTIAPGESLVYTFTAPRAGIWMYHCSTSPMSLHIANGMFGAVIIDPPDLPPVDHEFVMVQSEGYFGPQGGIADSEAIAGSDPDVVVFNGYPHQYVGAPLEVGVNERVRIWVLNTGLNRPSSFHVVGSMFDTVYFEGAYQLGGHDVPAPVGGSQALGLHPSQGGFVEFTLDEAGTYPFVSHLIVDAERGAKGLLVAVDD
jgi:nitrite reductase (NO-forming)